MKVYSDAEGQQQSWITYWKDDGCIKAQGKTGDTGVKFDPVKLKGTSLRDTEEVMLGEHFRPLLWNDKEISVETRWEIFKEAIENTVGNLLGGLSKQGGAGQTSKQKH